MPLCEVRIPTYKRPQLLRRALQSLIDQDYQQWIAMVMDDSPDQEGQLIVEELGDDRIRYCPNSVNLGCAKNINQAFQSTAIAGGDYAFILEDDNWLMPQFISENIKLIEHYNINIVLRNQQIWTQQEDVAFPTSKTTKGLWFTSQIYTPIELYSYLFFCEGISNGGLFWRTSLKSNLQVNESVRDAGLQEYCRTAQIIEPLFFAAEPLCYWSEMPDYLSLRNSVTNRRFGRGVQSLKRKLLNSYGLVLVQQASHLANLLGKEKDFELSLLDSLFVHYQFKNLDFLQQVYQWAKSYIKYKFIVDPLGSYTLLYSHILT